MEKFDDKEFLLEGDFPHWLFCPVKRFVNGQNRPQCGFVVAGKLNTVYTVNLFYFLGDMKGVGLDTLPKVEYKGLDELLADGWVVD